jgi:hypothetical protein
MNPIFGMLMALIIIAVALRNLSKPRSYKTSYTMDKKLQTTNGKMQRILKQ